jgi:alkylated DNA repair dioxygenase AlkB
MGDQGSSYGYSGIKLEPVPWQALVSEIKQYMQTLSGTDFNSVLLNYYRDGQDSVAWHADDEAELGSNPVIASLSLGAQRMFHLRHKRDKSRDRYRMALRNGSVLIMGNTLQNNWLHQLPKEFNLQSPRINLTFRKVAMKVGRKAKLEKKVGRKLGKTLVGNLVDSN